MFRRRQMKTHSRLAREELSEGFDHLRMAAAHAAGGAAGALAPRVDAARKAVKPGLSRARDVASDGMDSLVSAARNGSREAQRMARKGKKKVIKEEEMGMTGRRWPMMIGGLLVAGAAIGAASALTRRRRSQRTWDEYGSTLQTSDVLESTRSAMDAGTDKASASTGAVKDHTSDLIGTKNSGASSTGRAAADPAADPAAGDTTMADTVPASKNSRS